MGNASAELPLSDPMRQAFEKYKATSEYANSKHWALRVAHMSQVGEDRSAVCDLMPLEQRSRYVDGSLWAAFVEGWNAAKAV